MGLMDLPVELVEQIIDDIVSDLPLASLVAFSLTCQAARKLCTRYVHGLDWTAFRPRCSDYYLDLRRARDATEDNCRQLLQLLVKDVVSSHVYCNKCVKLHPFYDAHTELSPQFGLPQDRYPHRRCDCEFLDTGKYWLFDTSFSISPRQVHLIRHYYLHGYGIPAHLFSKEIEALHLSAAATTPLWQNPNLVAPGARAVPSPPRWQRRIWFYPTETETGTTALALAVRHELVAANDGAEARERAQQYLDSTPYWVCPHLRTHAIDAQGNTINNDDVRCKVGCSMQDPDCSSFWGGLHRRMGTRLERFRPGARHDPLRRGGRRVPFLDSAGTGAAAPLVSALGWGEEPGVWIHCFSCKIGTHWKMESNLSAQAGRRR
ncbi:hypothetical protein PG984_015366 [Apiospora sp. TS-2023a]